MLKGRFNKKKLIPLIFLLLICTCLYYFLWGPGRSSGMVLRGEVEGNIYSQITEVAGKIIEMNLELGSPVKAGDLIARLDDTDQAYALEQLEIALEKRQLMLVSLLNGVRHEELEKARSDVGIAEANFRSAEAIYNQAQNDYDRLSLLYDAGGLAHNEFDMARLQVTIAAEALEAARGQIGKAREQLTLLQRGTDAETLALAEVDIKEAESKIRQMKNTIGKYEIKANGDGTVISINYNLGAMVNAGYNLVDISANKDRYVVCYVPKKVQLLHGQLITIRFNKKEYQGEVRFIDVRSQYTPKEMQTSAMRNKVSVKVKILLPSDTVLRPGNRVDVVVNR
jgi:HlyD family secretion protein